MRILITGATGFVGQHLIRALLKNSHKLIITSNRNSKLNFGKKIFHPSIVNLNSRTQITNLVKKTRPDLIIHLGAISHIVRADQDPSELVDINVMGTQYLCEAATKLNKPIRFFFASSALVYGPMPKNKKLNELSPTLPQTLYGRSKLAAENIVKSYESSNFSWLIVRPFNHIGPGQAETFSAPGIARRIIKANNKGTIPVGNIHAVRDFLDVRDVVDVYIRLIQKWPKNDTFVVSSGQGRSIKTLFDYFIKLSNKKIKLKVVKKYLRQIDPPVIIGDASKVRKILNWQPRRHIHSTLRDIFEEARLDQK